MVTPASLNLNATQLGWARKIVARIKARGFGSDGPRIADIALATAIVESGLYMWANKDNPESLRLPYDEGKVGSDFDSVGLYQQRPKYWGTTAELMDVNTSTDKFVDALRRLPWHDMTNGQAAQRVQVSAYPNRYAQQDAWAQRIRAALWNEQPTPSTTPTEDDMIINIAGKKGARRGGLYYVNGGKATFIGGRSVKAPGRYPMFTSEAEIKRLQSRISGLK